VVDVRGVLRIDSAGEGALALMKTEGAEFLASGIRMRHLVKGLAIEAQERTDSTGHTRSRLYYLIARVHYYTIRLYVY
jgi:hypothetical protein